MPKRHAERDFRLGIAGFLILAACDSTPPPGVVPPFDDRSAARIEDQPAFERLAKRAGSQSLVKFVLTDFASGAPSVRYLDTNFYSLHDEWYWFRLLNGQRIPGDETPPFDGRFDSVADIYAWARGRSPLPLDLRFTDDGRLYSPRFYRLGLDSPRILGLGGLLRVAARADRPERWLFELEYSDTPTHAELSQFFAALERTLPEAIGARLAWVIRSPAQEVLARRMEGEGLAYADRLVRYAELAIPGEVEVYNAGLSAGRLRVFRNGEPGLERANDTDVLVLDFVPDALPPAAALITAVPQTPLAHVNVLAKNRGIPNLYRGGIAEDPSITQLARVWAPVIVRASAPDRVEIVPITEQEYAGYLSRKSLETVRAPAVATATLAYTLDLEGLGFADVDRLRPAIGGKSAGLIALAASRATIPHRPLALTVRAYVEHFAPLAATVGEALLDPEFRASARTRFLVLEGPDDFLARFTGPEDRAYAEGFVAAHANALGVLVMQGGLRRALRDRPIEPATMAALRAAIAGRFAAYPPEQGLRFRSSSNVEDIEGFNGAGLYESNTGYLSPEAQVDPAERKKSLEWAIKKTWASYWSAEAFEERRRERVEHSSGAMAVLVHARFDDALERSNGVLTHTVLPPESPDAERLELNLQKGAVSVTNPEPGSGALPEVDRVVLGRDGTRRIERVRASTLEPGGVLLDDGGLLALFEETSRTTRGWLEHENAARDPVRRGRTSTLDMELRHVGEDWPRGLGLPSRVVLKQARSLEPGLRRVHPMLRGLPFPRDVLSRALRVERWRCERSEFALEVVEAYTDPLSTPALGYDRVPFVGEVALIVRTPILGFPAGVVLALPHPEMRDLQRAAGPWELRVSSEGNLRRVEVAEGGRYLIESAGGELRGDGARCRKDLVLSGAEDYLLGLLAAR